MSTYTQLVCKKCKQCIDFVSIGPNCFMGTGKCNADEIVPEFLWDHADHLEEIAIVPEWDDDLWCEFPEKLEPGGEYIPQEDKE